MTVANVVRGGPLPYFPLVSSWAVIINTAGFAVPSLLIGAWYGTEVLGWLALGERVIGAPSVLIGQSISQVYTGNAVRLAHADPEGLVRLHPLRCDASGRW